MTAIWFSGLEGEICNQTKGNGQQDCALYNLDLYFIWRVKEAFSRSDFVTAVATVVMAIFTGTLWWSTRGMLRATNETIRATNRNFAAEHRPWISVNAELTRLRFERGEAIVDVTYTLKNTGNSPAGTVHVDGKAVVVRGTLANPNEARDAFRAERSNKGLWFEKIGGLIIFPDQTVQIPATLNISRADIEGSTNEVQGVKVIFTTILICANYCFTFEEGNHQTVATFGLGPVPVPQMDSIFPGARLSRLPFGDYAD
jgi:hypothetical protein